LNTNLILENRGVVINHELLSTSDIGRENLTSNIFHYPGNYLILAFNYLSGSDLLYSKEQKTNEVI